MTEQERRELVVKAYEQLKASFDRFKKPNGDKNDPGKTCKDIWSAYPESKSGQYWVDPNEGDPKDAILVYCDMKKKATCVVPKPEKSSEIHYEGKEAEIWLGEIKNGLKVFSR
jgi:collagen type II alpha